MTLVSVLSIALLTQFFPEGNLTPVAAAFYRSDVICGSETQETSAGRARAMMHKFAVAPARLVDNGVRRAIGIAPRPQHIIGDALVVPATKISLRAGSLDV
ncbi:hypothetical protein THAOC_06543, partial [Thalassiosira oceanica]